MTQHRQLRLAFLWHMHQPEFRDQASGEFRRPWVYLHALKDYTDMAAHLEQHPHVKATINLVPILLDQLDDYADQIATGELRDPLLRLLVQENLDAAEPAQRQLILNQCFRANHTKMIEPFAPYKRLHNLFEFVQAQDGDAIRYLSGQYLADLLTWYHLSWSGETVRRSSETVVRLMARGENFTHAERVELFHTIGVLLKTVVGRYRNLAQRGQIELTTTPHYHPIGPLLLDFQCAHESTPDAPLPKCDAYPGGRLRTEWHLRRALESHKRRFGENARGVWPAEGAVSGPMVRLLAEHGVRWAASGERVLAQSLERNGLSVSDRKEFLFRPYRADTPNGPLVLFFRDDRLSDLIGFEYKDWHGQDAAQHFIAQLEQVLTEAPEGESPIVSVILDGENAWEYYPYNGFYFLHDVYSALETHPTIRTVTFSEVLDASDAVTLTRPLSRLVAGSWVYGYLTVWIGSPDKNRAWELLCNAKQSYDLVMASGRLTPAEAEAASVQLAVCEGSDWFWWFGDYNPSESVRTFDQLFRADLANLYRLLKLSPPAQLDEPVSVGGSPAASAGAMRRAA